MGTVGAGRVASVTIAVSPGEPGVRLDLHSPLENDLRLLLFALFSTKKARSLHKRWKLTL